MNQIPLYPLRFGPIFQYRLWGGRRLADLFTTPLPGNGPIGEAWLLSDRDDYPSLVADGPLKGKTIAQLLKSYPEQMMGKLAGRFQQFPLLLKFLDAREMLSVQVHPSDRQTDYIPSGEHGKTEAWVVLESTPESRIFAGLKTGTTAESLMVSIEKKTVADNLASFIPKIGDGVFLQAGTVHSLGGPVVFEVQENSDVTFRLYDWDRIDSTTGKKRDLQIKQAIACIDFTKGALSPVVPVMKSSDPVSRELLFNCEHFDLWRIKGELPFKVGAEDIPRVLVCTSGGAQLEQGGNNYILNKGDVFLLPVEVGVCVLRPRNEVSLFEIAIPEGNITK